MQDFNPLVSPYFAIGCGRCPLFDTPQCKVHSWQPELAKLRAIVLDCMLTEELKWSMPTYTWQGNNVAMIAAFKDNCTLSFFKGALLQDAQGLLQKPGDNSQVARVFRFTDVQQIVLYEATIKAYLFEAIEVEKAGLKVETKKAGEHEVPEEFAQALERNPALKTAFEALTPGRQRAYLIHFGQPKQSATRISRIDKCVADIMAGKGYNEDWKQKK